jgi:hypothetical protein
MNDKLLYAVMYTPFAQFLGSGCALYVKDDSEIGYKVALKGLTEAEILKYSGQINRLDLAGLNPTNDPELLGLSIEQFSGIMTQLAEQEPNETLGVLTLEQGQWLYDNHPLFIPTQTNDI